MTPVGVRELKNQLSRYLRRVRAGEQLVVTERGRPVAVISAPAVPVPDRHLEGLLRQGIVRWSGGKPKGARRPPRIKGPTVAQAVIEDRR
jgi:antitoxin (DNA-binding transcriptional repressor) of toxin-antitoxin stability system